MCAWSKKCAFINIQDSYLCHANWPAVATLNVRQLSHRTRSSPMSFRINCPTCQASYTCNDLLLGKQQKCKKCGQEFVLTPTTSVKSSSASQEMVKAVGKSATPASTATVRVRTP